MKRRAKLLAFALAAVMCLTACGGGAGETDGAVGRHRLARNAHRRTHDGRTRPDGHRQQEGVWRPRA